MLVKQLEKSNGLYFVIVWGNNEYLFVLKGHDCCVLQIIKTQLHPDQKIEILHISQWSWSVLRRTMVQVSASAGQRNSRKWDIRKFLSTTSVKFDSSAFFKQCHLFLLIPCVLGRPYVNAGIHQNYAIYFYFICIIFFLELAQPLTPQKPTDHSCLVWWRSCSSD